MSDYAIRADGLGKRYRRALGPRHDTLRDLIVAGARRLRPGRGTPASDRDFWALRDVSFDVRKGESLGVIGLNGAGKSTLLKLLSRIVEPTIGRATVAGRVGALLEVGTGFHWELTGRENIYLYSAILGMRREQLRKVFDSIVEFSGVGSFIDMPVKRYSSGMYVRLAFSVAAHLQPDILLLDEVLSVGDVSFQRKCMQIAKRLQESDATLLFVSHNMFSIKTMCSRVIYLRGGQIAFDGATDEAIRLYEQDCRLGTLVTDDAAEDWPIFFEEIAMLDGEGRARTVFDHGESVTIRLGYRVRRSVQHPNFVVAFIRSDGVAACNFSSELDGCAIARLDDAGVIELAVPKLRLTAELYAVHVLVREPEFGKILCGQIGGMFHVRDDVLDFNFGVFHEQATWTLSPPPAAVGWRSSAEVAVARDEPSPAARGDPALPEACPAA